MSVHKSLVFIYYYCENDVDNETDNRVNFTCPINTMIDYSFSFKLICFNTKSRGSVACEDEIASKELWLKCFFFV